MAMKWIELSGSKHPKFGEPVLVWNKAGAWFEMSLKEKTENEDGCTFIFGNDQGTLNNATHYMLIEPPKNNQ